LKQHTKTHQQQEKKLQGQKAGGEQWQQHASAEAAGDKEHNPITEPVEVPVSVAASTDVVSLAQVIPYLETIRVEYY
jgi:hypothetical protein